MGLYPSPLREQSRALCKDRSSSVKLLISSRRW